MNHLNKTQRALGVVPPSHHAHIKVRACTVMAEISTGGSLGCRDAICDVCLGGWWSHFAQFPHLCQQRQK